MEFAKIFARKTAEKVRLRVRGNTPSFRAITYFGRKIDAEGNPIPVWTFVRVQEGQPLASSKGNGKSLSPGEKLYVVNGENYTESQLSESFESWGIPKVNGSLILSEKGAMRRQGIVISEKVEIKIGATAWPAEPGSLLLTDGNGIFEGIPHYLRHEYYQIPDSFKPEQAVTPRAEKLNLFRKAGEVLRHICGVILQSKAPRPQKVVRPSGALAHNPNLS